MSRADRFLSASIHSSRASNREGSMARPAIDLALIAVFAAAGLPGAPHPLAAQTYEPRSPRVVRSAPPFTSGSEALPDGAILEQIGNIPRDRPPQAEAAARAFV